MGFKTFADGNVLTAADVNDYLMKQAVIVCTAGTRPGSPVEGMTIYQTDTDTVLVYNGSAWTQVTPATATVDAEETHTAGSYGDLSTSGPAVTLTTGTKAIVLVSCQAKHSVLGTSLRMSWAVSGATTIAAQDTWGTVVNAPVAGYYTQLGRQYQISGLTAGSNTFTAKYMGGAATGSFLRRTITVWPIP
ncbi:MAG: hypothetical protein FJW95_16055 [Actinobacteria bacterium]|nr:hypothetical protein [Actinomycetota bacterium]